MPGKGTHTAKFDRCVTKVKAGGKPKGSAYAICTASFQKAGTPVKRGGRK